MPQVRCVAAPREARRAKRGAQEGIVLWEYPLGFTDEFLSDLENGQRKDQQFSRLGRTMPVAAPLPHAQEWHRFQRPDQRKKAAFEMSPQPLSRVRPSAAVMPSPDAIGLRPKLAPLIAEIIARWADIEANIGTVLSYVLRTEAGPIAAMLHAIISASAQMDMIHAAGSAKLFDPELEVFEAVIKVARAAAKKRNAIAHHIWGYTTELPDALLLMEPEAYSDIFVDLQRAFDAQSSPEWVIVQPDTERTLVYRENDFNEIIAELKVVARCTTFLINYLQPKHAARDRMYQMLCSEPLIDAALKSIRKSRQPRSKPKV